MEYAKTTGNLHVQKRVIFNGPNKLDYWLCAVNDKLISKHILGVASRIEPYPILNNTNFAKTQQKWIRKDQAT